MALATPVLTMRFRHLLPLACLGLVACGTSLADIVRQHRAQSGLAYRDCGVVDRSNLECPHSLSLAEQCMRDAFTHCDPAEAAITQYSVEGDPVPEHWFIEPTAGGCRVVRFTDSSQDAFKGDYADLERFDCQFLPAPADPSCPYLTPSGCDLSGSF